MIETFAFTDSDKVTLVLAIQVLLILLCIFGWIRPRP